MKKIFKIIIIIIFVAIIALFIYIGTPKKLKIDSLGNEEKTLILLELNLKYIPLGIELISIETPRINMGPYYYINYSFNLEENEKFIIENNIYGSKKYDIKQIKEENNKVYYKQILTSKNNLKAIQSFLEKQYSK